MLSGPTSSAEILLGFYMIEISGILLTWLINRVQTYSLRHGNWPINSTYLHNGIRSGESLFMHYLNPIWKSAHQIDIPPQWHQEWGEFIHALSESHIRIKQGPDELVWCMAEDGIYAPKKG